MVLVLAVAVGRGQSIAQWIAWGDASMEREEYYGASRFYAGALAMEPGRMSLQWKQAEACRLSNQYDKAAAMYEKVQRKDMSRTYTDALRWLAEMQMCQGLYTEAERNWNKLLQREKDKSSFNALRAATGIEGCKMARETQAVSGEMIVEHLPQPVNSYDSEFGARIGPDSALYFTSLRGALTDDDEVKDTANYFAHVFDVREHGTTWNEPRPLPPAVNSEGNNANATWSLDGKWFLFTRCVPGAPCRIHVSPAESTDAQAAHPLPGIGDSMSTQPMVVDWDHRQMLLFVTDRDGGQGGTDIWQAELHDGEAKFLAPLGRPVNTPGNERTPWYDAVTNTLHYSSDFLPGLGGFDIFTAAFGNDVFAGPVNAGSPINSPANDLYPTYDRIRNEGWFTSNRIGSFAAKGETCCNDLYRYRMPEEVIVQVDTPQTEVAIRTVSSVERLVMLQQRFPLKLYFHNDDPDPRSNSTTTSQTYQQAYDRYKGLERDYEQDPNELEAMRAFFRDEVDFGYLELEQLVKALEPVLEDGGSATLEVRGHASPLAKNDYNRHLSQRRIESLRNHLRAVDNGRLRPYLNGTAANGARLTIKELPFGEERSAKGVSDDLADLKHSVYSVGAASERRIEIEALQLLRSERAATTERLTATVGTLVMFQERDVIFHVKNSGTTPMHLLSSEAACGCTTAELPKEAIAPGGQVPVTVHFSGRAADGPLVREVTVLTDGTPGQVVLVIEGTVVP